MSFPSTTGPHYGLLLLRTAPGTRLAELTIKENVVFQADGITSDEAWSVVKGRARVLEQSREVAQGRRFLSLLY